MVWCSACAKNCDGLLSGGYLCCSTCGRVIDQDIFTDEPSFVKNSAGQSQLAGNFIKTVQSDYSASRERTLKNAYDEMNDMAIGLNMEYPDSVLGPAIAFYTIALERNFTRGRRKDLVEAACLYIACRENKKPYLLIDFSDYLKINVYVLGSIFLQLCKLLSLEEHPIVQKPVDPTIFMHRFVDSLVGNHMGICKTAVNIIRSMQRDWMQTGRKPSGLCGAALYISALSYGHKFSKSDVVRIVHVCEATLTKRLIEFENTESGSLTIEELNTKAKELDDENSPNKQPNIGFTVCGMTELLCEHKGSGISPFAHGLCKSCYDEFIKLTGGLDGGSEPPAFQRAEKERMAKECSEENDNGSRFITAPCQGFKSTQEPVNPNATENEKCQFEEPGSRGGAADYVAVDEGAFDKLNDVDGIHSKARDDSESFSDIDDIEVDGYLHNEEEKHYKKIIWEEMNKEYIEEQAVKEKEAAAAKKAFEEKYRDCPEQMQAAQELAAAAAAAVAKSRKERQQKRAADAKNSIPAQTPAEATRQMLTKKRLSSKINYDALDKLFDEAVLPQDSKKSRTESHSGNNDNRPEGTGNDGELGPGDEYEDAGGDEQAFDNNLFFANGEEEYKFDYDDDEYGYDGF